MTQKQSQIVSLSKSRNKSFLSDTTLVDFSPPSQIVISRFLGILMDNRQFTIIPTDLQPETGGSTCANQLKWSILWWHVHYIQWHKH